MNKSFKTTFIVLASLFFLVGFVPFLVPVPALENTVSPHEIADADSLFVDIDGLEVHLKISGQGQPVYIMLHGFGASLYSWREVIGPLAETGTVIAYDRPAFGLTERPLNWEPGKNPYTPKSQVDLIHSLMNHYHIEQAVLIGNSAGGAVSLNFALSHPEHVAGLVLVDAAVYQGGGAPHWIQPLLGTPQLDHLGPLIARQISLRGDAFLENSWSNPSRISAEVFAEYRKPLQINNWDRALWELTKVSSQGNLADQVGSINLPALVISGEDDQIVPLELSQRLADDLPDAKFFLIPDCGHLPQEECPEKFLSAVYEFTADLGY